MKAADHVTMPDSISDSDSAVNSLRRGLRNLNHSDATRIYVTSAAPKIDRDDVVSRYTRYRIRLWEESGKQLQELARAASIAKSSPSQVKRGANGVGHKTEAGYAKAFGFASVAAFRDAAWAWWRAQGAEAAAVALTPHTPGMAAAIDAVLSLQQGSREQIETILSAYMHSRFHERDSAWWTQTLLAELARDSATLREDKAQRDSINQTHREMRATREAGEKAAPAQRSKKKAS